MPFPAKWHRQLEGITFLDPQTLIVSDEGAGKRARLHCTRSQMVDNVSVQPNPQPIRCLQKAGIEDWLTLTYALIEDGNVNF